MPDLKIDQANLHWIAGLLEGEGCFTIKNPKTGTKRSVMVTCHMTDKDVLDRLRTVIGYGLLLGPYSNGKGHKPRYVYSTSGESAYHLMKLLLPLMCSRRSIRIKQLIRDYDSVKQRVFRIQNIYTGKIESTTELGKWLLEHDITHAGLYRTLIGERNQCKGWRRLK